MAVPVPRKRTSRTQLDIYLNYLEAEPVLRSGRFTRGFDPKHLTNIWEKVSADLNSCPDGPTRTTDKWWKVFMEWKLGVKRRARQGRLLNDLEKKMFQQIVGGRVFELAESNTHIGTIVADEAQEMLELGRGEIVKTEMFDRAESNTQIETIVVDEAKGLLELGVEDMVKTEMFDYSESNNQVADGDQDMLELGGEEMFDYAESTNQIGTIVADGAQEVLELGGGEVVKTEVCEQTEWFEVETEPIIAPESVRPKPSKVMKRERQNKRKSVLLSAYRQAQNENRQELKAIAAALNEIAKSIHRFADVMENKI